MRRRGSQDSNLESPVLETGALASWATAPEGFWIVTGRGRQGIGGGLAEGLVDAQPARPLRMTKILCGQASSSVVRGSKALFCSLDGSPDSQRPNGAAASITSWVVAPGLVAALRAASIRSASASIFPGSRSRPSPRAGCRSARAPRCSGCRGGGRRGRGRSRPPGSTRGRRPTRAGARQGGGRISVCPEVRQNGGERRQGVDRGEQPADVGIGLGRQHRVEARGRQLGDYGSTRRQYVDRHAAQGAGEVGGARGSEGTPGSRAGDGGSRHRDSGFVTKTARTSPIFRRSGRAARITRALTRVIRAAVIGANPG
jgi:hypothetical protein